MISGALSAARSSASIPLPAFDHVEPRILEVLGVHFARIWIVVDDEHTRAHTFDCHFRPLIGTTSVKVEPFPTSLRNVMLPSSI